MWCVLFRACQAHLNYQSIATIRFDTAEMTSLMFLRPLLSLGGRVLVNALHTGISLQVLGAAELSFYSKVHLQFERDLLNEFSRII